MNWQDRPRSGRRDGIAWLEAGAGPPLVFLHGVGLRAEAFAAQLDAFEDRFAVRALDLPGHGESAPVQDAPALADFTARVADAVLCLGAPAFIVGHSMGAMIAMDFACRFPDACLGVAALNAIFQRSREAAAAVRARAAALDEERPADPGATLERWFGSDVSSDAAVACRRWLRGVDPAAYRAAYRVFADEDGPSEAALRALRCPALFVTGSAEPNSTPKMSRRMAALTPSGEAVIIDGAAHMMPMTHADAVNNALTTFLDRCLAATR